MRWDPGVKSFLNKTKILYMILLLLFTEKFTEEKTNDVVFVDNKNYEVLQVDFLELYGFILASVFSFRRKSWCFVSSTKRNKSFEAWKYKKLVKVSRSSSWLEKYSFVQKRKKENLISVLCHHVNYYEISHLISTTQERKY